MPASFTTIDEIANEVLVDKLHRGSNVGFNTGTPPVDADIQDVCRRQAVKVYRMMCAAVPFDELDFTTTTYPLVPNTPNYTIGPVGSGAAFILNPWLRAIKYIQIQYDGVVPSTQALRLRRSSTRVYASLATTPSGRTATYSRLDNSLTFNPPPQNAFTITITHWSRPNVGLFPFYVTGGTIVGGVATLTLNVQTPSLGNIQVGDIIDVSGISPPVFNQRGVTVTAASGTPTTSVSYANGGSGTYVSGGIVRDRTAEWNQVLLFPEEWEQLLEWETLYRVYYALDMQDKARSLIEPQPYPQQPSVRKQRIYQVGIIPKLWNDLLATTSQKENVDEDFNINPIIRNYSVR